MARPIKARIDTRALRHNYRVACDITPGSRNIAVVKANAYGHGAALIARPLDDLVPAFAVAGVDEALELRAAGIRKPVLLLEGPITPDEVSIAPEQDFWLMVCCREQVDMICRADIKSPVTVWLKIDSGMHRLGVTENEFRSSLAALSESANTLPGITLATHLADAHNVSGRDTAAQVGFFQRLVAELDNPVSIANSAGILNGVRGIGRPGIGLYGGNPYSDRDNPMQCVATLEGEVLQVRRVRKGESVGYGASRVLARNTTVAVVGAGYADGVSRLLSNRGEVAFAGVRLPVLGRVSMDLTQVDATDVAIEPGDWVEFFGPTVGVDEVAAWSRTIAYEVLTGIGRRVERRYLPAAVGV